MLKLQAPKQLPADSIDYHKLVASVCRESYFQFVRYMWHTVVPEKPHWNWHIPFVCDEIQKVTERVFRNEPKEHDLLDNQPPGTTKSLLFSVFYLPWCWTRMPSYRVIGASYAYPLALNLSRLSRDVIRSDLYQQCFPEIEIRADQDTKGFYANTRGGSRYAVGSNGSVTGMHAHAIVIDDPLDPNEATSEAELARTNYWIEKTLLSRKVNKASSVVITVMQRLHEDDPSAQMKRRGRVRHLRLPATTDYPVSPSEALHHYKKGLFDPVRLPKEYLREAQRELGDYGYAGQMGQDPVPPGGGMFKVDQIRMHPQGQPLPKFVHLTRFWDKAATAAKGLAKVRAAYTVGLKMGVTALGEVYVLDVIREQLDSYARERLIRRTARLDGQAVVVGLEEEPGSGGKESAQRSATTSLRGFRVRTVRPTGDKETRARSFSVAVNKGSVCLVKADWNKQYLHELKYFPFGSYKDQVDASSGAYSIAAAPKRRVGGIRRRNPDLYNLRMV